jgi:DNA-directed RNA polymerase subunit RPC12/RpoP
MTDKTYVCAACENKIEAFEKDGVTVVYNCQYCKEQEATLKRLNAYDQDERLLKANMQALGFVMDKLFNGRRV